MKATVNTNNGSKTINIEPADVIFSEKEYDKMERKFNRDTTVLEFVGGVTYCVTFKGKLSSKRLKSSSLDELFEMYKSAWKGKEIQERKCFFHK